MHIALRSPLYMPLSRPPKSGAQWQVLVDLPLSGAMGVAVGGPCVGLKKHQGAQVEPPQLCAAVTSHKWYSGPTCKNCYERNKTAGRKRPKMARTEDAPAQSRAATFL